MNPLLILLLVLITTVLCDSDEYPHQSSYYGCPDECGTQEHPKCEIDLPNHFVALHPNYFKEKVNGKFKYCGHYYVGMIIDTEKADGSRKLVRAKVVDQCGTCHETQVDLNQPTFEMLAKRKHGIVKMMYVLLDSDNNLMDGPIYSGSDLDKFAKQEGLDRNTIKNAFVEAAKKMNKNKSVSMSDYPWKSGSFKADSSDNYSSKKTTKRTTKKTTTTRRTTRKIETTSIKHHTHTKVTKITSIKSITKINVPTAKPSLPPTLPPTLPQKPVIKPVEKPVEKPVIKTETVAPTVTKPTSTPDYQYETEKDTDYEGGSPVTASIIGGACVCGAAGIGLMMLKRKSPQKYNELKQRFPEAFTTVKRTLSKSASTIKRGVSRTQRSLSRRGTRNNTLQNQPIPASYSFTLSSEDGLPRVALYDDPYPTRTNGGSQHW